MVTGPQKYIRHAVREWLALLALLLALAAVLTLTTAGRRSLEPLSLALYDLTVSRLPGGPSVVTVVAIDEASIAQLGRWPWRRAVHAALLNKVNEHQPSTIGIDVLFSEPAEDDAVLATSLSRLQPVVLATDSMELASGRRIALLPTASLLGSNTHIGHVGVQLDIDSTVRRINMSEGGIPALPLKLAELHAAKTGGRMPAEFTELLTKSIRANQAEQFQQGTWASESPVALPFGKSAPEPIIVSYGSVLRGEFDPAIFRNRIVLLGATASGLGDVHVTPSPSPLLAAKLLPGVLIHAKAISALQNQLYLRSARPWTVFAVTGLLLCVVMSGLFSLSAGRALLWVFGIVAAAIAIGVGGLWWERLWLDCAAAVVLCSLAYPLWSWRRLKAAVVGLSEEANALSAIPAPWPRPVQGARLLGSDPIGRRLASLATASSQLQVATRFYAKTLDAQAHPVLVIGARQRIMFANAAAQKSFASPDSSTTNRNIAHWANELFPDLLVPETLYMRLDLEKRDKQGRDWYISMESIGTLSGDSLQAAFPDQPDGSRILLQLVNISALRAAQRERDEAMRFLSHDIRSPQVSLITWVTQERKLGKLPSSALDTVEMHSRHALAMADAFLQMARAESQELAREEVSISILCDEAVDACFSSAKQRNIRFKQTSCEHDVVRGDASLLRRALINLIENALNYGPADALIMVSVTRELDSVCVSVQDQGDGIAPNDVDLVFKAYHRGPKRHSVPGTGLGLPFVRTVAQRHGGTVQILQDQRAMLTIFKLAIPAGLGN